MGEWPLVVVALALLAGCPSNIVPNPDPTPAPVVDTDGDGVPDADDCAPEDASVYPGAEDTCDGVDTDCVDDPLDVDEDGDGVPLCAGDCDDTNATRFPGNEDVCDGVDTDCAEGPIADDVDADGDGSALCAGDCDDTRPDVGHNLEEVCDGWDNDCNGTRDDIDLSPVPLQGDVSLAKAHAKFLGEFEDDLLGTHVAAPGDVNGDGYQDFLMGTNQTIGGAIVNRAYLLYGPICGEIQLGPPSDGIVDAILWNDGRVSRVGDLNGDGYDDIGLGSAVLYGPIDANDSFWLQTEFFVGPTWGSVDPILRGVGDVNGDGYDDLAVLADRGGPVPPGFTEGVGEVAIFFGPLETGTLDATDADVRLYGTDITPAYEGFGHSVAAGDFTGDGVVDVAVGTSLPSGGSVAGVERPSRIYVFEGPLAGEYEADQTTIRLEAEPEVNFGRELASGDFDADGVADLLTYGPPSAAIGVHRLFFGPLSGAQPAVEDVDYEIWPPAIGWSDEPLGFGDVNGDGVDDLVVRTNDSTYSGQTPPEGWSDWDRLEAAMGSAIGTYQEAAVIGVGREETWEGESWFVPADEGDAIDIVSGGGLLLGAPRGHNVDFSDPMGAAYLIWFTE